ncbi:hypothetical protein J5N97_029423 [Dioscorea zingiberensis]|uniref:RING-type domain-containing protein n=1 Tax=Dioscorea zingiberensis TaxID=325984 RepID=A0A9D5C0R5_9LILI|nr:hypothetical protein J5N97_029423 [Dioscorea zingiberensis]
MAENSTIIEKALPVIIYKEVLVSETSHEGCCSVCLDEFEMMDKVRWITGCRHVFHRRCIDRWIDSGHRTCPLCRAPLFSDEVQEELKDEVSETNSEHYFRKRLFRKRVSNPPFSIDLSLSESKISKNMLIRSSFEKSSTT